MQRERQHWGKFKGRGLDLAIITYAVLLLDKERELHVVFEPSEQLEGANREGKRG